MDTALSHLASFALGLLSGYLLMLVQDWRRTRQALSKEAYRPLHEQIHKALRQFETSQKAVAIEPNFWKNLEAAGVTGGIKPSIQTELRALYTNVFPAYDMAWQEACLRAVPALLRQWDQRFGQPPGGVKIREANWWQVATDETFFPDILPLQNGEALRFHDWVIQQPQLPGTLEAFIKDRKRELEGLPAIRELRARRAEAMNRSADVLRLLVEKIVI